MAEPGMRRSHASVSRPVMRLQWLARFDWLEGGDVRLPSPMGGFPRTIVVVVVDSGVKADAALSVALLGAMFDMAAGKSRL